MQLFCTYPWSGSPTTNILVLSLRPTFSATLYYSLALVWGGLLLVQPLCTLHMAINKTQKWWCGKINYCIYTPPPERDRKTWWWTPTVQSVEPTGCWQKLAWWGEKRSVLLLPFLPSHDGSDGAEQAGRATKRHFLLAILPLPSRQRSILLHRLLPIHPNQTRLWRSVQTCFIRWGKKRQPPKVQLKNWPNFAQSFLSSRHYNINKAPRQKLIYQVIIWLFLLLSLSFLCRRMISETMLDLAAYLRRFYSSWLTDTPFVIQLLSARLLKLVQGQ